MDDLSRALDEALLKDLECPVCMEYIVPPILLCTKGHNICSKCKESVQCCPTCRTNFSEIRSVALENIVRRHKYPCANRQNGCLELFSIEHIAKHHAVCVYGKIKCPLNLRKTCSWNGFKNDLKEHVKATHPVFYLETPNVSPPYLNWALAVIFYFGELFIYYSQKKNGIFRSAVQLIGTSSEASKYKCEYTLRAENGIEQISKRFLVHGYSEDFESSFNSGKCLRLEDVTVRNFVEEDELKLTVTLSKV